MFSSFNNMDLSQSMLANCWMRRCRGEGTMAAIEQWRPPWLRCVFLTYIPPSKLCVRCPPTPKPPKNQPLSHLISPSIMVGWGRFKYPSYAHAWLEDTWAIWTKDLFILESAVPGEASETMVELWFWQSTVLVGKLAIRGGKCWAQCNPLQKS